GPIDPFSGDMPDIHFTSNGSDTPGYLAEPADLPAPGIVVLQEWWGLDDHIRSVCDRLAAEGFVALAPDLYRREPTTQPDEAQQRMMALSMDQAEKDMRGAAKHLISLDAVAGERLGAVGFCLGGGLAVWAAAASPLIGATVTYYYVMPTASRISRRSADRCWVTSEPRTSSSRPRTPAHSRSSCAMPASTRGSSSTKVPVTRSSTTPTGWAPTTRRRQGPRGSARSCSCADTSTPRQSEGHGAVARHSDHRRRPRGTAGGARGGTDGSLGGNRLEGPPRSLALGRGRGRDHRRTEP